MELDTFIKSITVLIIFFVIGLYLQIKIIRVSKKEKDVTWRLDVCNSTIKIVFFSHRIIFEIISYCVPSLHQYSGKWFCYYMLFVNLFGAISLIWHSFILALYKYVYILHQHHIRDLGVETSSFISSLLKIIIPAVLSISFMARPTIPSYACVFSCLGKEVEKSAEENETSADKVRRLLFCGFDRFNENGNHGTFGWFMNITNITGCFLTSMMVLIIMSTIVEAFVYQRIFSAMKK